MVVKCFHFNIFGRGKAFAINILKKIMIKSDFSKKSNNTKKIILTISTKGQKTLKFIIFADLLSICRRTSFLSNYCKSVFTIMVSNEQ